MRIAIVHDDGSLLGLNHWGVRAALQSKVRHTVYWHFFRFMGHSNDISS